MVLSIGKNDIIINIGRFSSMIEYNEKGERFFAIQIFNRAIILYLWFIDVHLCWKAVMMKKDRK